SQTRQRIPTRIRRCLFAGAGCEVLVLTAARAEALAVRLAEGSGRQGEQHLLAHDILEQKTALLIITDFGLVRGNGMLSGVSIYPDRPKNQVKIARKGLGDGLDAAGAEDLEVSLVGGAEADILHLGVGAAFLTAVLDDEVGLAFYGK